MKLSFTSNEMSEHQPSARRKKKKARKYYQQFLLSKHQVTETQSRASCLVALTLLVLDFPPQHLVRNEVGLFDVSVSTANHRTPGGHTPHVEAFKRKATLTHKKLSVYRLENCFPTRSVG